MSSMFLTPHGLTMHPAKRPLIHLSAPSPPQETAGEKDLDGVQAAGDLRESVSNGS
jgi:hypothetical protein